MAVRAVRFCQGVDPAPRRPDTLLTSDVWPTLSRQGCELAPGESKESGEILVRPALPLPIAGQGVADPLRILLRSRQRLPVRTDDRLVVGRRERGQCRLSQGETIFWQRVEQLMKALSRDCHVHTLLRQAVMRRLS